MTTTTEKPKSKTQLLAQYKSEAIRVYEDDKYLVVYPTTYNAMCIYGYGATWCVTSSDEYIFEGYKENPMFVMIMKGKKSNDYQEKYLCQFETQGIVDNITEDVNYNVFFNEHKVLADVFKDIILNDKYKKYSDFEKDYFTNYILNVNVSKEVVDVNPFD